MEFLMNTDSLITLITGAIVGGLAGRFMGGLGLIANIVIGLIGGLLGGYVFDVINILNVGDLADPIIAGLVGSLVLLAIAGLARRYMA